MEISFAYSGLDVDCEDIKLGQNTQIFVKLPGDARGNVSVTINNETHIYEINETSVFGLNGFLSMPVEIENLKSGQYDVSVVYEDLTANGTFEVQNVRKYTFNSSDLIKDYKNDSRYSVQVLADGEPVGSGQNVTFLINGVEYVRTTNDQGVAHLNINLEPGNYIVYSEYKNFRNYNNIKVI